MVDTNSPACLHISTEGTEPGGGAGMHLMTLGKDIGERMDSERYDKEGW